MDRKPVGKQTVEGAERPVDLIERGIESSRSAVRSGDTAIAAYLLNVPIWNLKRVAGSVARSQCLDEPDVGQQ